MGISANESDLKTTEKQGNEQKFFSNIVNHRKSINKDDAKESVKSERSLKKGIYN